MKVPAQIAGLLKRYGKQYWSGHTPKIPEFDVGFVYAMAIIESEQGKIATQRPFHLLQSPTIDIKVTRKFLKNTSGYRDVFDMATEHRIVNRNTKS